MHFYPARALERAMTIKEVITRVLAGNTVRVIRYRQHTPDGTVIEVYSLTNFSTLQVGSEPLYRIAKSRWEVENQGFNDAKNRSGFEHIAHHHANNILICWLLLILAMTIERFYRLRHLHRGTHTLHTRPSSCFASCASASPVPTSADTS